MPRLLKASNVPLPAGAIAVGGLALWMGADDVSAASLGGAATSVGVLATLVTLVLVKGWQAHVGAGGLSTLAGLFALATGAGLLWRSGAGGRRPTPWRRSGVTRRHPPVQLPTGLERAALLDELQGHFFALQAAWDLGARDAMSRMTTPDMLDELCAASSAGASLSPQRTEFLSLHAELLLFEERASAQVVCVEYSGMVREPPAREAAPFREFWMLTRTADASSGWRLARHQALL